MFDIDNGEIIKQIITTEFLWFSFLIKSLHSLIIVFRQLDVYVNTNVCLVILHVFNKRTWLLK